MPASWQTDLKAARNQAAQWADSAGSNQGWPSEARAIAGDIVTECYEVSDTAGEFWAILAASWQYAGRESPQLASLDGWSSLQDTWESAVQAASSAEDEAVAGKISTQVLGALDLTWEDVSDAARNIPDPRSWGKGLALLALVAAAAFGASR